ncbi:MAG: hypothetical protein KBH07_08005 [Flavobacteriales bacterium]|nr:hypothetical protein [Flavobacteriales bacterium]MBP9080129.1 hypothetical protein [Flavobacteriales bacterium]
MKATPWSILPWAALVLASSFIAWDVALMSRTARVQAAINTQLAQLDGLVRMGTSLDLLEQAHADDRQKGGRHWPEQLGATRSLIGQELAPVQGTALFANLHLQLEKNLVALDSLHRQSALLNDSTQAAAMAEAVFGLVVRRMQVHVEASAQRIRQEGLSEGTLTLGRQWGEAQWLLGLASLFALVCAALVAYVAKLLRGAQERTALLARTGQQLEHRNRELRETMLSKEEKEVMLKEIHHRVKNNLQIVRSLIRFQTDKVSDPHTMELFNECVNRVGAMALVHEQTYLSKDLANIDVRTYLNALVRDLIAAYNIRLKLNMDVDIQVKTLPVDTLTPLGLLINEVVSNSFKHAFKGRDQGTIILHLSGTEGGGLLLRIGDDGVGLPDKGTWERPGSLGMELIHTLAGQLNATVSMRPEPGMVYELVSQPEVEVRRRA